MAKRKNITTTQLALMTAAAVISLRGLPMMAQEELTMFFYIFFATFLFLIPAALVGAELGSAFADRGGGVYTWVKEAFNRHLGFSAIFLQRLDQLLFGGRRLAGRHLPEHDVRLHLDVAGAGRAAVRHHPL